MLRYTLCVIGRMYIEYFNSTDKGDLRFREASSPVSKVITGDRIPIESYCCKVFTDGKACVRLVYFNSIFPRISFNSVQFRLCFSAVYMPV